METTEILKKNFAYLKGLATVVGTLLVFGTGYAFYRSSIWRPNIKILKIDWPKHTATVQVGNAVKTLYQYQTLSVGGSYGVKFSDNDSGRIELVKNSLTYKILATNPNNK